jgi:uncharacterized NAD(P)/FAD-binding protein YdhS
MSAPAHDGARLAIIGAGPAASSLLERISANAGELLAHRRLTVHLIDPHRAGTGRVWRADNHAGLWMNSLAEDVTMFTDHTVACEGPIRPGPSLYEWTQTVDDQTLVDLGAAALIGEIRSLAGTSFPTRRVQSAYLEWFHRQVVASLPDHVELVVHRAAAIDLVEDANGTQTIQLDNGQTLSADVVVLALGHLDSLPGRHSAGLATFADEHRLTYVAAGHTAELDLTALAPGADVIALGFGQAFTDLIVLVTEGRGGKFVDDEDGSVRYEPSGAEPIIHVGSRRGVPYRSKIDYRLQAHRARLPRFFDEAAIHALLAREAPLEFRRDVLPLVLKEVGWSYYYELFHAHPERTLCSWDEFSVRFVAADGWDAANAVVADAVADRDDIFDFELLNAPLAGLQFESAAELHRHVRDHVHADIARRTDAEYSADLGAFNALLYTIAVVGRIAASGRMSPRSRVEDAGSWWFSFFMYFASGPPPARLRQLLALEAAGLVHFIGAGITVRADDSLRAFVATSTSHPEQIVATTMIDARVANASLSRTADLMLQQLRDRGDLLEEVVTDADGWHANTGKVVVTGSAMHLVRADGRADVRRHAIGAFTSRPAAGAFSRPNTNAPTFRQNDAVARSLLAELA